jgi:integrase/recombinase XerC
MSSEAPLWCVPAVWRLDVTLAPVKRQHMPTTRPSSRETHRSLPDAMREAVDEFAQHLGAERNRSANTIRAYAADTVSLLDHAVRMGVTSPGGLTIGVLRSWLARLR